MAARSATRSSIGIGSSFLALKLRQRSREPGVDRVSGFENGAVSLAPHVEVDSGDASAQRQEFGRDSADIGIEDTLDDLDGRKLPQPLRISDFERLRLLPEVCLR